MKKLLIIFVAVMATLTANATVVDLGVLELDTDYALEDFKGYKGSFTPTKSGVLTFSSTTTDDLEPFSDEACTKPVGKTNNGQYGPHSYDMNVEAGVTYYFYTNFIMNSHTTIRLEMPDCQEVILVGSSPAIGGVYNVSSGGQMSFDFNKAVTFTNATITIGSQTQKIGFQVSNSSIFSNDVKTVVWNALTAGTLKEGDEFTITINGIALVANSSVLYDGTGTLVASFKVGKMPITLVSTEHTTGNFLSYYTTTNEEGIVRLHFSGNVGDSKLGAVLRFGNIDEDTSGEYYVEYLTPTIGEDGKTIEVNLQGKRRRAIDMVSSGTDYEEIVLGITGVTDEDGNYAYASGSGSVGSYWFKYTFKEVTANIVAEFTPSNGSDLNKYNNVEIWITDENKLSYDGVTFTYPDGAWRKTYEISNSEISKEQDSDDATAKILTFAIPADVKTAQNVELTFTNLQCADGTDYSNILRAKYNAFVITRTNPVANSTIEKLTAGQEIKVYTNRDTSLTELVISLVDQNPTDDANPVLFEEVVRKNLEDKGFVYTCSKNHYLAKGHDYRLCVETWNEGGSGDTDYVVYHGAATKVEDYFLYGYDAAGISLQDTLPSKTAVISGFSNGKHTGTHYALLEMPENVSTTMEGCQITRVGFYPFLTTQPTAKIVISNEIGGTPLYEQEVTDIKSQTWQLVDLDTPFTINNGEKYYIGYTIESAQGEYPIGYYYTSDIMGGGVIDPILDYIAYEESGTVKSGLIDTQMYGSRRQLANLMLYATIEAPYGELPQNAIAVGTPSFSTDIYVQPNADMTLTCLYNNTATKPLTSYKATVKDGDTVLAEQTITLATELKPMEEGKLSMKLPTTEVGLHDITITLDEPNGESNEYSGAKTAEKKYLVFDETVKRNVLLEHFTTGMCVNCVSGEEKVESELSKVSDDINVIRINHHSGFDTDKLTTADDVAYVWFYGGTYVWAPANMIDRTDLAAYGATGYGGTATLGPVFGTDKSSPISSLITSAAGLPAFVNINVEATADENRELKVVVKADELYDMPQADIMRLNVALVEDGVVAAQKLDDGSVDKNFIHDNVSRENLTGTWGELVEFEDKSLEREYTLTLKSKYNIDNLRVVAFFADYDENSTKNCRVYNVVETKVKSITEGVENINNNINNSSDVYNLQGQRVGENYRGVVIKNGKKYISK